MDVVTGAMGNLAPKLIQLLRDEYKLQKGLRNQVRSFSVELESVYAALCKVGKVPPDQLDKQAQIWAREVREASYDMEDVLDSFLVRVDGRELTDPSRLKRALKRMGNLFSKAKAHHDIAGAIEDIKKQLQEVAERHARYKIDEIVAKYKLDETPATTSVDPRLSDLYTKASQLVGIDEPRDTLVKMLSIGRDDECSKEMKIISIVGFGGLGKTTLAKAVYDKVNPQFVCGAFVPVGRNPDPRKVLRDILIDLTNDTETRKTIVLNEKRYTGDDLMGLDERQLINELREFLQGKRYFIVVDDLWDTSIWRIITNAFVESNQGSRILVTSRNGQVSEEIGDVYRIKELSQSNSRLLLYTRTFGSKDKWPDNDEVAEISYKIMHKCHGVPLAIITIASLLASKQIKEWPSVYNSIGFGHGDNAQVKNMKKILSFSYYDLPSHLRACMLYLSAFPEDYLVEKEWLIWRWIAEGLISEEGKALFEVADSYFHELINRGMVLPRTTNGIVTGCQVHDMVLHMIRDMSRHENFFAVLLDSKQGSQGNIRRLALHTDGHIQVNDMGMPQVRSFNAIFCRTNMTTLFSGFQFLRVLALEHCCPSEDYQLEHIGKLLHLRYLGLKNTRIRELPKEIGDLKFLQTLMLDGTGIEELPTSLGQLTKLMCLRGDKTTRVPDWIGKLTSLVELWMYLAADMCFVKQLGKLRHLRVLYASINPKDEGLVEAFLLSLGNLQKIEFIGVWDTNYFPTKDAVMQPSPVLYCNNLRYLDLGTCIFSRLPAWINPQSLPNLCSLRLLLCELGQQGVEILGRFRKLCCLVLAAVSEVSPIISICGGGRFQNLKSFDSTGLPRLKFEQEAMPSLEVIGLTLPLLDNIKVANLGLDIGLGNLSSLQSITVGIEYCFCFPPEVEKVEAELRHEVYIHPNRPTLEIKRRADVGVPVESASSDMLEQRKERGRLWERVFIQTELHRHNVREAAESSYTGAKDKVQPFFDQFNATAERIMHELHPVREDTSIHHRDLNRMVEDNAAMERALKILTVEYPRLAAMLEGLRSGFSLQEATPGLEVINLNICVLDVKVDNPGLDFGLGNLSSLQEVKAHIECNLCFPMEVEELEVKLRQTVGIHPNSPTLEITRFGEDEMVTSSDSPMLKKRQQWRASKLWRRINHQKKLYSAMRHDVVEMGNLKTDMNLSYVKQKVGRFLQQFGDTLRRVNHELLLLPHGIPVHDRDLNIMANEIAAMERALEILTVEYPRFAATLDGLRYVFSLQVTMPRHEVSTLTIDVCDVMVRNLGLDFGLGNLSSLQAVKAHIDCHLCLPTEVQEVEAELRHAVNIHPNRPTLEITRYCEDKMAKSDSDMLERQMWKARILTGRIHHRKELHAAMRREAVEIGELKTGPIVRHKMQRLLQQFDATAGHVEHELLPVREDKKCICHRDLDRLTHDIEAMERALEIYSVEHPRLATKLARWRN